MIDLNAPLLSQEFPKADYHLFDLFDTQVFSNKTGKFSNLNNQTESELSFYQGDIVGIEFDLHNGSIFFKNA